MGLKEYRQGPPPETKEQKGLGKKPRVSVPEFKDTDRHKKWMDRKNLNEEVGKNDPEELVESLTDVNDFIIHARAFKAFGAKEKQEFLKTAAKHIRPEIRAEVAKDPDASAELILQVSEYVVPGAQRIALSVLVAIAQRKDPIGGNEEIRTKIFNNVLKAKNDPGRPIDIEETVFKRKDCPAKLVREEFKRGVIGPEFLKKMETSNPEVLRALVEELGKVNPKDLSDYDAGLLNEIAGHEAMTSKLVKLVLQVAKQFGTLTTVIKKLRENKAISEEVKRRMKLKDKFMKSRYDDEKLEISKTNDNLYLEDLAATTLNKEFLRLIVDRVDTKYSNLLVWIEGQNFDYDDQYSVAEREKGIFNGYWRNTLKNVAQNPNTPKKLKKKLVEVAERMGIKEEILKLLNPEKAE